MSGTDVDDAALGARVRAGDEEAFAQLYERYLPRLHDFAARLLRDPGAAEDVVQSTFIRAYEHRETLRDPAKVRAWLFTTAHNLAMNHLERRRQVEPVDDRWDLAAPGRGPEAEVVARDAAELVWSAAAGLEPRQYAVLDMSVRQELSTPEIAEVLGLPAAHAAVLVNRAREALGNAVRFLMVARRRDHCSRLAELVPAGVRALSPEQRSMVDHHMRHCEDCRVMARRLTEAAELFGGLATLPVPAGLGHWRGWSAPPVPQPGAPAPAAAGSRGAMLHSVAGVPTLAVIAVAVIAIGSGTTALLLHSRGQGAPSSPAPGASATFQPSMAIRPSSGPTGSPALATVSGFPPGHEVAVRLGNGPVACSAVTNTRGAAACVLTVSWDAARGNQVGVGATDGVAQLTAGAGFTAGPPTTDMERLIVGLEHPSLSVCGGSYAVTVEGQADLYANGAGAIVASTTCLMGTASSPYEVATYVPVTDTLRQKDVLSPGTTLEAQSVVVGSSPSSVTLRLSGYAPGDAGCCPSLAYTQTFTFPAGVILAGPVVPTTAPFSPSTPPAVASITPAQIAATLNARGVDCSSFATSSGRDPGAGDQGHCGTFPVVIDIAVFPTHDALVGTFVPFLRNYFCSSSPALTDTYVDGGTYAIYSLDNTTTLQVATALGLPASRLC